MLKKLMLTVILATGCASAQSMTVPDEFKLLSEADVATLCLLNIQKIGRAVYRDEILPEYERFHQVRTLYLARQVWVERVLELGLEPLSFNRWVGLVDRQGPVLTQFTYCAEAAKEHYDRMSPAQRVTVTKQMVKVVHEEFPLLTDH